MKDGLVRATHLPLVLRVGGTESLPRGSHVTLRLTGVDLLTLEAHANLLARLDDEADAAPGAEAGDEADDDAEPVTTGLALAIDLDDGAGSAGPDAAPAAPAN
jgi:exoribonuclease-2